MASGGGEQSSRKGFDEECRRQTIGPPDPDATMRPMTSRSPVACPLVVNDCVETPPSPVHHYQDAADLELCERKPLTPQSDRD